MSGRDGGAVDAWLSSCDERGGWFGGDGSAGSPILMAAMAQLGFDRQPAGSHVRRGSST